MQISAAINSGEPFCNVLACTCSFDRPKSARTNLNQDKADTIGRLSRRVRI